MDSDDQSDQPQQHEDLTDMTLQEIQALRQKIGIKRFNQEYNMGKGRRLKQSDSGSSKKKAKKSRPMEMSSKHPLPIGPMTLKKKAVTRDPRFDDLSGTYNEEQFKRSYKFVDRLKAKEFKNIQKIAANKEYDDDTRQKAKDMLTRLKQKKDSKKTTSAKDMVNSRLKDERKQALKEGKRPYFLKKAEKKKLVLAEKYKELKSKGQLESFMRKKRKANAEKKDTAIPTRSER